MSHLRRAATLTTLALASAGLAAVTAQPASAAGGGELRWAVSQYVNEHLSGQTFTGGATASDGVVTFVDGTVEGSSVRYAGTARYAFAAGGVEYYSYSFSDVTVTYDDGSGTIAADVAWTSPTGPGALEDTVLTTFSTDDDWSDGALTATPDWLGVAPADAYGAGKPVDGASWAVDFVSALPASLQGTFYASGSGNDSKKPPAAFTATDGRQAAPSVTATPAYDGNAVTIDVAGTGFSPVYDPATKNDGIYTALAPAGSFPETDDFEDQEKVAATTWVLDSLIVDGSWTTVLVPQNKYLDPRKSYSVYTWQAHEHSNTDSDTETPVSIDFSKLGKATALKAVKKGKKLVVTVGKGAAGKVAVKFTKGKVTKKASAKVVSGQAKVALPSGAGRWKAAVSFTPWNASYRAATKTFTLKAR